VLRYWYDYSYAEIAEAMTTTESAIKSRLFRARRMLADLVDDAQDDDNLTNPQLKGS
jgi:RNA polymerase sigma-70 factor (ECF subfamily)